MGKYILGLLLVISLSACDASSKKTANEPAAMQTNANPADSIQVPNPQLSEQPNSEKPKSEKYQVTFLELGAESCIPCKMMQPILKEIATEYPNVVEVIFHDLYKNRTIGKEYGVRVMPTQIFLDSAGKEFFRHEGFYGKEELKAMLDKYLANLDKQ